MVYFLEEFDFQSRNSLKTLRTPDWPQEYDNIPILLSCVGEQWMGSCVMRRMPNRGGVDSLPEPAYDLSYFSQPILYPMKLTRL